MKKYNIGSVIVSKNKEWLYGLVVDKKCYHWVGPSWKGYGNPIFQKLPRLEVFDWCQENLGEWSTKFSKNENLFLFKTESDMLLFRLRWL